MISKRTVVISSIALIITIVLVFITISLFKKTAFKYEHIQLPGPGYLVNCSYLPAKKSSFSKESVLVVYLHGLFANREQGFRVPSKYPIALGATEVFPNTTFLSCDYGTIGSWCNTDGYKDITCAIEGITKQFPNSKIIITGISMGGCTALSYAASAPENIKEKIIGVLAIYAAGDLTHLYKETKSIEVQQALENAFNGSPQQTKESYLKASFVPNISKFPSGARVYVISALKDKVVPSKLQDELIDQLKLAHIPFKTKFLSSYHVGIPSTEDFIDGLRFILSSTNTK